MNKRVASHYPTIFSHQAHRKPVIIHFILLGFSRMISPDWKEKSPGREVFQTNVMPPAIVVVIKIVDLRLGVAICQECSSGP